MGRLDRMDGMDPLRPAPMNAAAIRQQAASDGYLFCPAIIAPRGIEALQQVISRDLGRADFQAAVLTSPEFAELRCDPGVRAVLEILFRGPAEGGCGDVCRVVPPGPEEFVTRPHQDAFYIHLYPRFRTVWIAVMDCPAEMGPIAVSPASHRRGLHRHDGERGATVPADIVWNRSSLGAGDVVMFHSRTLHCTLGNRSSRARSSVDCRYRPVAARVA